VLGSGFEVITVGKKKLVRSVPTELNKDHNEILELAQVTTISSFLDYVYVFSLDPHVYDLGLIFKVLSLFTCSFMFSKSREPMNLLDLAF